MIMAHARARVLTLMTGLALTAESDYILSKHLGNKTTVQEDHSQIRNLVAPLTEAFDKEKIHVEDEFQARVCLASAHWALGDFESVISRLPENIELEFAQLDGAASQIFKYTQVSALKATYLKGTALYRTGAAIQALVVFDSALPILSRVKAEIGNEVEVREWTERYLTQFCMLSSKNVGLKLSLELNSETLTAFRAWALFWEAQPGQNTRIPEGSYASDIDVPRRRVWKEYYAVLSTILQDDLPYPTNPNATMHAEISTRLQQRTELQRVETRYESLMLKEITFPRAEQASEEVEEWIRLVMGNWKALCGNSWREEDLGRGGKEALSRSVLDILYRAATKTFHSTTILRHLFMTHMAVAEFDLALKAFDTYLDIVKRGKARVEKTGKPEHSLDDDATVVVTASECIKGLCRYGSYRAAEKAKDVAIFLVDWLKNHHSQTHSSVSINNGLPRTDSSNSVSVKPIPPEIRGLAWRSIGISQAQLARLTHEAEARIDLQQQAVKSFQEALSEKYKSTTDIETLFALAVVLAERREITPAIEVVKTALLPTSTAIVVAQNSTHYARKRSLTPLWHLLALLLSARQDFATALRACDGAFEQFHEQEVLFGQSDAHSAYRSEHLNHTNAQNAGNHINERHSGISHDMDDTEKENILEIKMTQLVLVEILEGPEAAVNASDDLFSLYTTMFGDPQHLSPALPAETSNLVPQSSAGTLKSVKGSIFGHSRPLVRKSSRAHGTLPVTDEKSDHVSRTEPSQTVTSIVTGTPTINIGGNLDSQREKSRDRSGSLIRKKSQSSDIKPSVGKEGSHPSATISKELHGQPPEISLTEYLQSSRIQSMPDQNPEHQNGHSVTLRRSQVGLAVSSEESGAKDLPAQETKKESASLQLPDMVQNLPHIERALQPVNSASSGHQDTRLPTTSSSGSYSNILLAHFSKEQIQWRHTAVLIKVWLLVSGFYRRAAIYNDANDAINEAEKLVEHLEIIADKDSTNSSLIESTKWGHNRNIGQLRGDISSEVSSSTNIASV